MAQLIRFARILLGIGVVAVVLLVPWLALDVQVANQPVPQANLATIVWHYWTGERRTLWLHFAQPTDAAIGDPIFIHESGPEHPIFLRRVGEIQGLYDDGQLLEYRRAEVTQARAFIYPSAPALAPGLTVTYRTKPQSVAWVIGALFTPERKARIALELEQAAAEHREELLSALRPVVEHSLRDVFTILEEEAPAALARHEAELAALGDKYRRDVLAMQLLPLVQKEILPTVLRRAEPVAEEVGRELWQRISLWSFGWRWAYDISPLPEKNLANREWNRFVEKEALPIFEEHADDFVDTIQNIMHDLSQNEHLQEALRASLAQAAEDPQLHKLMRTLFDEVILHNPRLRDALEKELKSPQARQAFDLASSRLEPVMRRIGDMIFGTQATGITPEFAQVLRSEILDKDRRWFLLVVPERADEGSTKEEQTVEVRLASDQK